MTKKQEEAALACLRDIEDKSGFPKEDLQKLKKIAKAAYRATDRLLGLYSASDLLGYLRNSESGKALFQSSEELEDFLESQLGKEKVVRFSQWKLSRANCKDGVKRYWITLDAKVLEEMQRWQEAAEPSPKAGASPS